MVLGQQLPIGVLADPREERRRSLDIREEKGDGPARQFPGHATSVPVPVGRIHRPASSNPTVAPPLPSPLVRVAAYGFKVTAASKPCDRGATLPVPGPRSSVDRAAVYEIDRPPREADRTVETKVFEVVLGVQNRSSMSWARGLGRSDPVACLNDELDRLFLAADAEAARLRASPRPA